MRVSSSARWASRRAASATSCVRWNPSSSLREITPRCCNCRRPRELGVRGVEIGPRGVHPGDKIRFVQAPQEGAVFESHSLRGGKLDQPPWNIERHVGRVGGGYFAGETPERHLSCRVENKGLHGRNNRNWFFFRRTPGHPCQDHWQSDPAQKNPQRNSVTHTRKISASVVEF